MNNSSFGRFPVGLVLIAILSFQSCQDSVDFAINTTETSEIVGLSTPIRLAYKTTSVIPGDYFLHPDMIDSIDVPEGLQAEVFGLYDSLHIVGRPITAVSNFRFWIAGVSYDIPVKASEKKVFEFSFTDSGHQYQKVQLSGSMNGWVASANPLHFENGAWHSTLILNPGDYYYHLHLDEQEILDPQNERTADNGFGGFNSVFTVMSDTIHHPGLTTVMATDKKVRLLANEDVAKILVYWQNHQLDSRFITRRSDTIDITLPDNAKNKDYSYLRVFGSGFGNLSNNLLIPLKNGQVVFKSGQLTNSDPHTYIMYFLMIDRFYDGNPSNNKMVDDPDILPQANFKGGDIKGVTDKITTGYFDSLGINTIWLSPIVQNPDDAWGLWNKGVKSKFSGYHGYWPVSSTKIDQRFGTSDDLYELIDKAHQRHEKVLLDYVANHVHLSHPVLKTHPDWVTPLYLPDGSMNTEKWDEYRLTTWFDTFLATLDLRRPEVADAMSDSALYWFKTYQIDGFRHDATKHIDEIYWRYLNRKLREQVIVPENRSIYQIGETYGNPELIGSYISSGMLDAQFDFNVYDASVQALAGNERDFNALAKVLNESLHYYGSHNLMGNISGNQDRPRFISLADSSVQFDEDTKLAGWTRKIENRNTEGFQKLLLLQAINMSIPGIPVIYYGDEIGLPGGNDPDNRRMMAFNHLNKNQKWLKNEVSYLTHFRSSHIAMIYGETVLKVVNPQLMVIQRTYFDKVVYFIINNSSEIQHVSISLSNAVDPKLFKSKHPIEKTSDNRIECDIQPISYQLIYN